MVLGELHREQREHHDAAKEGKALLVAAQVPQHLERQRLDQEHPWSASDKILQRHVYGQAFCFIMLIVHMYHQQKHQGFTITIFD